MLNLKRILIAVSVALILSTTHVVGQTDSAQLVESRDLNAKVIKLFGEGKFDEALPLAKQALQLRETALGPIHPDLIPLLTNLGEIFSAKKQPSDARRYFERALGIAEKSFGESDLRIARLLDRLGLLAYNDRQTDDAERFFSRSLKIKETTLGSEHVDLAPTIFNLAEVYRLKANYEKSEQLYDRLVRIRGKAPGKDNADLIKALEGYARVLEAQKKDATTVEQKLSELLSASGIVQGGVLNGKALKLQQPEYPTMARIDRASGTVRVRIVIDETGHVVQAKAVDTGSTHLALVAAAEEAARKSLFTPTFLSGKPVKVTGIVIYNFVAQ
jgi:TonB family protein